MINKTNHLWHNSSNSKGSYTGDDNTNFTELTIVQVFISAVLFLTIIMLPSTIHAETLSSGHPENICPLFGARYKPHPRYERFESDFEFEMSIRKSGRKPGTTGPEPRFFYKITMYDRRSGGRLSQILLGSFCTMNVGACYASAGDDPRIGSGISVKVLELNRDLSPYWLTISKNQDGYSHSAPYALIFPYVQTWFYRVEWEKIKNDIVYFSKTPVHPNIEYRDVWVFSTCAKEPG